MFEKLDNDNFLLYAAKHYDNPQCETIEEFNNDLKRINYIKKLLNKLKPKNDVKKNYQSGLKLKIFTTLTS